MTASKRLPWLIVAVAAAALSAGCSGGGGEGGRGSAREEGSSSEVHPEDWVSSHGDAVIEGGSECTACHGEAFAGGQGPACTDCHGENSALFAGDPGLAGLAFGAQDGSPAIDHPSDWVSLIADDTIPFYTFEAVRHGYVAKADDQKDGRPVGFGFCADCHADEFTGRSLPPPFPGDSANCLACHGNETPHSTDLDAWRAYHHITTSPENASVCAECHANGENSPLPAPEGDPSVQNGCFNGMLCHTGSIVTSPIVDHFENHWEFHQRSPEACMICHGEDFRGRGAAPACFRCHGRISPECTSCHLL